MTERFIQVESGAITVITLHRLHALNALNRKLLQQLLEIVGGLQEDASVRAVIITGTGDKAFCAGADLKERQEMNTEETRSFLQLIGQVFNTIEMLPMPTIAAINGIAFGGGLELALACDIRVTDEKAQLGLTEVAWGIIPGAGGTQRLPRLIGSGKARMLILSAEKLDASKAYQIGLVEKVVPHQTTLQEARLMAEQIASHAPLAVRAAKSALLGASDLPLEEGLQWESECYERVLFSHDRLEGLKAFAEKRRPAFAGN